MYINFAHAAKLWATRAYLMLKTERVFAPTTSVDLFFVFRLVLLTLLCIPVSLSLLFPLRQCNALQTPVTCQSLITLCYREP